MPELGPFGSVRGVSGNGHPYRDRFSLSPAHEQLSIDHACPCCTGRSDDSTIAFGHALKARGCAAMHVSSGGVSPLQKITLGPGYQVPLAQSIKAALGLPTIACGLITEPEQAEAIVAEGRADAVALARAMLYDPRWPWHAAARLGAQVDAPHQYWRSQPRELKDLFKAARVGMR